jgi:nickel/cobalt transporter (NiCoT) family protein
VTVALVIGVLVLAGLVVERLGIDSGPLAWVASLDLGYVGFGVVGLFVLAWAVALAVWRFGRIEERWAPEQV